METWDLPVVGIHGFSRGLCEGVVLGGIPGYPSLKTIPHTATLGFHGINLFNSESTNESEVITLVNTFEGLSPESVLKDRWFGNPDRVDSRGRVIVYTCYPFLGEALVLGLVDELFTYRVDTSVSGRVDVVKAPHTRDSMQKFVKESEDSEALYSKRYGIIVGVVDMMVKYLPLKGKHLFSLIVCVGMRLLDDGSLIKEFSDVETYAPLSTIVETLASPDPRFIERPARAIHLDFPLDSNVFLLSSHPDNCGAYSRVVAHHQDAIDVSFLVREVLFLISTEIF